MTYLTIQQVITTGNMFMFHLRMRLRNGPTAQDTFHQGLGFSDQVLEMDMVNLAGKVREKAVISC